MGKVQSQMTALDRTSRSLQSTLIRTFLVFGAFRVVRSAIRTLAEFDDAIKTVAAVSGATATQIQRLSDTAQQLGINTRFSALQAAEGLVTLARAGFTVEESQKAIGNILNLAQAGAITLAQAADIAATSLRAFGIEAENAQRVTDVLTLAANSANTTVAQLGQGLKFVGPIARGLSVSFEQTAAALATLSDAGLKATLAGTGFRRVLAELESPTARNIKRLRQLGIEAKDVKVSQVGLAAALEKLARAGVTAGDSLRIFGQRGGPAFEVLVRNIPALREFTLALERAEGVAKRTADIIDTSLKGALIRVESAYKGFIIAVGETGPTNALNSSMNTLAVTLRFVAENADLALTFLTPLITLLATRGIAAVAGFNAAFAAANPLLLAGGAAVFGVSLAMAALRRETEAAEQAINQLEEEVGFATLGAQITIAQREVNKLERAIKVIHKSGGVVSESQLERVKKLKEQIELTRNGVREQAKAQEKLNEATRNAALEETLAKLERQAVLLRGINSEKEIQTTLDSEIDRLLGSGQVLTGADKDKLEFLIRRNDALAVQQRVLQSILGPQEEFRRKEEALNALLARGAITADQFSTAIAKLNSEFGKVAGADPFAKQVESMKRAEQQQQLLLDGQEVFAKTIRIENRLRDQGVTLTSAQRRILQSMVVDQIRLSKTKDDQNKKEKESLRIAREKAALIASDRRIVDRQSGKADAESLAQLRRLFEGGEIDVDGFLNELDRLGDGPAVLNQQLELVNAKWKEGEISILEYGRALQVLETRGSRNIGVLGKALATLVEIADQVAEAFGGVATDAIIKFVETGKFSFRDFAQEVLKLLLRIIIKLLVIKALEAAGFGGAGTVSSVGSAAGAKVHGGTVQPDRPFIVGEEGPELLIPGRTGTVVPNAASVQQAPPVVNVQLVTVASEDLVPEAILNGSADKALVTRVGVLRGKMKQALGPG